MISIEPGGLFAGQQRRVDQAAIDWRQCQRLECVERRFRAGNRGFGDEDISATFRLKAELFGPGGGTPRDS